MSKLKYISFYLAFCLLVACSPGDPEPKPINPDPGGDTDQNDPDDGSPVVEDPEATTLVFPENQTECNEGIIVDENWSKVTFRWNESPNTEFYELWYSIVQEGTSPVQKEITTNTELEVQIRRGVQYQWYVTSRNSSSTERPSTDFWFFYNAGEPEENYAPFPATLINPKNGAVMEFDNTDSYYNFRWEASDLDEDILTYELFLGTEEDQLVSVATLEDPQESISNHVQPGIKYYWQIKTSDPKGSSSLSEVWSFTRY